MNKKLLYSLFISSGILLYCGNINAQVKTKIYYKGIPNERVINALNNEADTTNGSPENSKKLLSGQDVGEDDREYKEKAVGQPILFLPTDNEKQKEEKKDSLLKQKRSSLIEITPYFKTYSYPGLSYSDNGFIGPVSITIGGTGWGAALSYKHPIKENLYLVVGLGYFRYSFNKIKSQSRFGESDSRHIDAPTPLFIYLSTDKYWYHTLSQSVGIEKRIPLRNQFFASAGVTIDNYFSFKQHYHIVDNYSPKGYVRNEKRNVAASAGLKLALSKEIGKSAFGTSVLLPIVSFLAGDNVFPKSSFGYESTSDYHSKWFREVGVGIIFSYLLTSKK